MIIVYFVEISEMKSMIVLLRRFLASIHHFKRPEVTNLNLNGDCMDHSEMTLSFLCWNELMCCIMCTVIRDKTSLKTKGFGFASFLDPVDAANALKELNGKYVGNRPIKLRKSSWQQRSLQIQRKKNKHLYS